MPINVHDMLEQAEQIVESIRDMLNNGFEWGISPAQFDQLEQCHIKMVGVHNSLKELQSGLDQH